MRLRMGWIKIFSVMRLSIVLGPTDDQDLAFMAELLKRLRPGDAK